jgi:hypothetical protein
MQSGAVDKAGGIMTSMQCPVTPPGLHFTAKTNDVLQEQLQYLIAHAAGDRACGCSECRRYLRVRSVLLEIFRSLPTGFGPGSRTAR